MTKKWTRSAMRFASARFVRRGGMLDVSFENGDHFVLAADSALTLPRMSPRSGTNGSVSSARPDWTKLRIGETGDVLELFARGGVIEIPWDRIRSIADAEYRSFLRDQAVQRARRIGRRIRELRLQAGLTRIALATRVGVARTVIAQLETGAFDPPTDLLQSIAPALGRPLRDFAKA